METRFRFKSGLFKTSLLGLLTVVLFSFYYFVPVSSNNSSEGFQRVLLRNVILRSKGFQLKESDHYYQAGATRHQLFLGTEKQPLQLLKIGDDLREPEQIEIHLDSIPKRAYLLIDSPFVYVADKTGSYLSRGSMTDWSVKPMLNIPPFVQLVCIDTSGFVIHTTIGKDARRAENVLGKIQTGSSHILLSHDLLKKQGDGIYSTDGLLRYSPALRKIIYVYFYRNEYSVIDEQLKEITRLHTIDTVGTAKLNPVVLGVNTFSLVTPPVVVNRNARCYRQFLFVHSQIKAQNERSKDFAQSSVIDVYDLISNTYRFSFYIPEEDGDIKNFYVVGDKLLVLIEDKLISYDLNRELFQFESTIQLRHY